LTTVKMLREFRDFLLRGNIIDLAVAVVFGAAFAALVNSLVTNLLLPIVGALIGKRDFSNLTFTINHSVFHYGTFINSLITFMSIAVAVFFFIVKPTRTLTRITGQEEAERAATEVELLTEIRDTLKSSSAER